MGKKGRNQSEKEGDIVKKGYVYIKRPPTSSHVKIRLKAWQRRYFVLRDDSYEKGPTSLEIYPSEQAWQEREGHQQYTVDLKKVTQVEEYIESKTFPNAFTVSRKGQAPLILGADSPREKQEWYMAIKMMSDKLNSSRLLQMPSPEERRPSCPPRLNCDLPPRGHWRSQSDLLAGQSRGTSLQVLRLPPPDVLPRRDKHGFKVHVQRTQASERHMLEGDYVLLVRSEHIALRRPGSHDDILLWPIVNIRKFKCESSLDGQGEYVTLEGNIHCGSAEGTYLFKTRHGKDLIRLVRDAAREMSAKVTPGMSTRRPTRARLDIDPSHGRFHRIGSAPCLDDRLPRGSPGPRDLMFHLPDSPFSTPASSPQDHHPGSGTSTGCNSSDDEDVLGAHALGKFNSYLRLVGEKEDEPVKDNIPVPPRPSTSSHRRHHGAVPPHMSPLVSPLSSPPMSASSANDIQFKLDDLVPLPPVPPIPKRRDSGFSDSGNSFLYNDVFDPVEELPPVSPGIDWALDQSIPAGVTPCVSGGTPCGHGGSGPALTGPEINTRADSPPPLPPPRPRHTLPGRARTKMAPKAGSE